MLICGVRLSCGIRVIAFRLFFCVVLCVSVYLLAASVSLFFLRGGSPVFCFPLYFVLCSCVLVLMDWLLLRLSCLFLLLLFPVCVFMCSCLSLLVLFWFRFRVFLRCVSAHIFRTYALCSCF